MPPTTLNSEEPIFQGGIAFLLSASCLVGLPQVLELRTIIP